MTKIQKIGLASLAVVAVAGAAAFIVPTLAEAKGEQTGVAAVVNGDKILKKDVLTILKENNVDEKKAAEVYTGAVEQLVNKKLVDAAVAKSSVENSSEFKKRLAEAKQQLAVTLFMQDYIKNKVTDKEVKAAYDEIKKENAGKEEVHARHILLKTEAEAKQVIKDLDKGAKFADLAKERSTDPSGKNGGELLWFTKGELIPEFTDAAFGIKPGTYGKNPVKSQFGWHVIEVLEKRERKVPDLKEVEDRIRGQLGQQAIAGFVGDLRAKADIKLYDFNGKPLEEPKKN